MTNSAQVTPRDYWGYLIRSDKSPSPLFEQLLLGVANYISYHITPWDVNILTPGKLAHFYRLLGGDYDSLFLNTTESSLSFIYQSLGCYHTLQPESNPYSPPLTPALTPQGFVRWEVVQLLLDPEHHVPFLQNAVKRFDIINPADGVPFMNTLPREALPVLPDREMVEWHQTVSEKLRLQAQASADRNLPPRPHQMALSDIDGDSSRDSSVEGRSGVSTSMAGYFVSGHRLNHPRSFPDHLPPQSPHDERPWSSGNRRRRSHSWDMNGYLHTSSPSSPWRRDSRGESTPRPFPQQGPTNPKPHKHSSRHHARTPSDLSTISTSSSDSSDSLSSTSSAASRSPRSHRYKPPRRHSASNLRRSASNPQPQGRLRSADGRKSVRWMDLDGVGSARQRGGNGASKWDDRARGQGRREWVGNGNGGYDDRRSGGWR